MESGEWRASPVSSLTPPSDTGQVNLDQVDQEVQQEEQEVEVEKVAEEVEQGVEVVMIACEETLGDPDCVNINYFVI